MTITVTILHCLQDIRQCTGNLTHDTSCSDTISEKVSSYSDICYPNTHNSDNCTSHTTLTLRAPVIPAITILIVTNVTDVHIQTKNKPWRVVLNTFRDQYQNLLIPPILILQIALILTIWYRQWCHSWHDKSGLNAHMREHLARLHCTYVDVY